VLGESAGILVLKTAQKPRTINVAMAKCSFMEQSPLGGNYHRFPVLE
jgi:hypothetical protein